MIDYGKLKAFEVQMRIEDEEENPQKAIVEAKVPEQKKVIKEEKNLAFKSSKSGKEARSSKDSDVSSDDEIALMTQGFRKVLEEQQAEDRQCLGKQERCLMVEIRMCPLFPM